MAQTLSLLTGEELTEHHRREARVTVGKGVGYGTGMIGERMFRDAPALLLLVFMTNYLKIPAAYAGIAIFLPKLLLVFVDPLVGFYSDVSGSRAGRRRPFLVCGALLSGCAFVAMFNVPTIAATGIRTAYMIGLIGVCFAVYSVYSVPYLSFASDLSSDAYQRTRLLAYRMAFLAVGLNMSGSAGVLIEWFGGGITGYERMSYVYGLICLVTMLTPAVTLRDPPIARRNPQNAAFVTAARLVLGDVNYRRLLLVNFVQKMAEGVGYGSFAYFFLYWLDQPLSAIGACILASTIAQIVAQPIWVAASKRFSRTACCGASLGMYLIVNALWLIVPRGLFWPVPVLGFFAGVTVMGFLLMLVAMMTDVAVEKRETGDTRFEGMIGGMWLAIEKIGFAAGGALVALTLAAFGFVESNKGIGAPQSHTTLVGIAIAYVGLTTLLYTLTLSLDEEKAMEQVTLAGATAAIQAALAYAREKSLAPLAVAVLDAGGHVRAAVREDGGGHSGIDIAVAKARGALSFSMPSRTIGEIFSGNLALCVTLAETLKGQMLPIPGAVLIRDSKGRVVGAITAAGDSPDNDEAAATAGLAALNL